MGIVNPTMLQVYDEMVPGLTHPQRAHILALLHEMRELTLSKPLSQLGMYRVDVQLPLGASSRWWQRLGMAMPALAAASMTRLPGSARTSRPSICSSTMISAG